MATRIQSKSRPIKRGPSASYSTGTGLVTGVVGRLPKLDKKGFPAYKGLTAPVSVKVTVTA